jgi:hypothetical protein
MGCRCEKGFGGHDCSLIDCNRPDVCGKHGVCKRDDKHATDYCECEEGWTYADCSVKTSESYEESIDNVLTFVDSLSHLPYGEVFGGRDYYTKEDEYHDNHPVFNLSVIANIRILS